MTTRDDSPKKQTHLGEVIASEVNNQFRIRLETGEEISAALPTSLLRKFGCIFGNLVGWRVEVVLRQPPKMARIVNLRPS